MKLTFRSQYRKRSSYLQVISDKATVGIKAKGHNTASGRLTCKGRGLKGVPGAGLKGTFGKPLRMLNLLRYQKRTKHSLSKH